MATGAESPLVNELRNTTGARTGRKRIAASKGGAAGLTAESTSSGPLEKVGAGIRGVSRSVSSGAKKVAEVTGSAISQIVDSFAAGLAGRDDDDDTAGSAPATGNNGRKGRGGKQ